MQEDVFRGLRDWRQASLPKDMVKWRDLNLYGPGRNTAPQMLSIQRQHWRENHLHIRILLEVLKMSCDIVITSNCFRYQPEIQLFVRLT